MEVSMVFSDINNFLHLSVALKRHAAIDERQVIVSHLASPECAAAN